MKSLSNDVRWISSFPEKAQFAMIPKEVIGACSHRALQIYAALAIYRNYKTNICTPSINTLANNLNVSPSTVKRGLEELIQIGLIRKFGRANKHGGKTSCQYVLLTPWVKNELSPSVITDVSAQLNNEPWDSSIMTYKQEETNEKNFNHTSKDEKELFVAVCEATSIDMENIPKVQLKQIQRSVSALLEIGATPSEVHRRANAMRVAWTSGKVTHKSLLNHWAEHAPLQIVSATKYGYVEKEDDFLWDEEQGAVIPINKL